MNKNLKALLQICSLFGVCSQTSKFCNEHLFRIYIIFLMAIVVSSSVMGIVGSEFLEKEYIISWAVSTIVFISQMVTHFIILYETLTKSQEHKDFLRILHEMDVYFKILLKMELKNTTLVKDIRSNLIGMIVISKVALIFFVLNFLFLLYVGYFWWALFSILAMRFRCIQVIVYAEILKNYLLALNKKLYQIVCLKTAESKQLLDIDYKLLHSIEIVKSIKHVYASLYEASILINQFAQTSMFAVSVSYFLDFTCHIYWALLAIDNIISPFNIVSSICTILPLALLLFRFCYIWQAIKDECTRSALFLSRLLSCGSSPLVSKAYKNLVHDFCMQLMHQRIAFTGNRFFTFDLKCIFAICVLIGSHLIILIQFTKSDFTHSLNKTYMEAPPTSAH